MLAYRDFFQGQIDLYDYEITETGLCFLFQLNMPLPKPLHIHKSILTSDPTKTSNANECVINCKVKERNGSIMIPFYYGVLKHFFENYKDYYYLPLEDTAVHKSVAEYVEKDYRKKATKDTCYIKKDGVFLPQLDKTRTPEFQLAFKDKIYWFESTLLINSSEPKKDLKEYFNQIITFVVSKT